MGMDVHGRKPVDPVGNYFRNNVWWWRPLWDYCAELAPDLIDPDLHQAGHFNDGAGLDATDACALGARLEAEIAAGRTEEHALALEALARALPGEPCELCGGSGTRTWWPVDNDLSLLIAGISRALVPTPEFPEPGERVASTEPGIWIEQTEFGPMRVRQDPKECNGCGGKGSLPPQAALYPFNVENVAEFAAFCKASGGFTID